MNSFWLAGATVHDLRSSDPSQSIVYKKTLRADTLSSLYRSLLRVNPALQLGVEPTGAHTYRMYNAPKEEGLLRYSRGAKTFGYMRRRDTPTDSSQFRSTEPYLLEPASGDCALQFVC